ncbi:MAG: tetratricopeptide repeat protein [Spirochaetaceae bacterium]|jgi:tetratricopeptide (TPR) repeat protein|nr:tetratricopeptide repeat protein [Spirochaetaceae bacterium]
MKFTRITILLIFAAALCGCKETLGKIKLVEGNFYFSRGMINEAIGAYLEAAESLSSAAYANFALGSTYLALEQIDAALERFSAAEKDLPALPENLPLLHRVRYNSAVSHFERGEYAEAAAEFRAALEADNADIDAKRNLELSLVSMHLQTQATEIKNNEAGTVGAGRNDRNDMIFDYIREHETTKWKSWEWAGQEPEIGPDY